MKVRWSDRRQLPTVESVCLQFCGKYNVDVGGEAIGNTEKFSRGRALCAEQSKHPRHQNVQKPSRAAWMMSILQLIRRRGRRASSKALDKSFGESAVPDQLASKRSRRADEGQGLRFYTGKARSTYRIFSAVDEEARTSAVLNKNAENAFQAAGTGCERGVER